MGGFNHLPDVATSSWGLRGLGAIISFPLSIYRASERLQRISQMHIKRYVSYMLNLGHRTGAKGFYLSQNMDVALINTPPSVLTSKYLCLCNCDAIEYYEVRENTWTALVTKQQRLVCMFEWVGCAICELWFLLGPVDLTAKNHLS